MTWTSFKASKIIMNTQNKKEHDSDQTRICLGDLGGVISPPSEENVKTRCCLGDDAPLSEEDGKACACFGDLGGVMLALASEKVIDSTRECRAFDLMPSTEDLLPLPFLL